MWKKVCSLCSDSYSRALDSTPPNEFGFSFQQSLDLKVWQYNAMVFAHNMRAGGFESLVLQWRCIFWKFWMFETLKVWMFWKFGSTMVFTPNMRAAGFAALWMVVRLARWLVDTAPLNRWHMLVNGSHTRPTPFPKWFSAPHKLSYFFIQLAPFNMKGPMVMEHLYISCFLTHSLLGCTWL